MSDKETGGSAFPVCEVKNRNDETILYPESGMTLRDYFAAKAIPAVIEMYSEDIHGPEELHEDYFARRAYMIAEAMLKAREA